MAVIISKHARKQMAVRGITDLDVLQAIEAGELIFKEVNHRFGLKKYTKLPMEKDDLIVVWFSKGEEIHVVTVYWRRKGDWYG